MLTIIILCLLFSIFGIGGLIFTIAGSLLKFSFKILTFNMALFIIFLCGTPLVLVSLLFGGLAFLF